MRIGIDISIRGNGVGGGGAAPFFPSGFLAKYPTARYWSPRQLDQADGTAITQLNELSANANHIAQGTSGNRPTFTITGGIGRAVFDTNDFLTLGAALNIGSVTKMTVIAAVRHTKATGAGAIMETGNPAAGGAGLYINNGSNGAFGGGVGVDASNRSFRDVDGVGTVPRNYVGTVIFDTALAAADEMSFRVDGIAQSSVSLVLVGAVSGNIASAANFQVGARVGGILVFNSELFDLLVVPGAVDLEDVAAVEAHLFDACGF